MKVCGKTDKGRIREINEDDYCLCENRNGDWLAIVCDGIGGSAAGEVASHLAVKTVYDAFLKAGPFTKDYQVDEWIRTILHEANDAIYTRSMRHKKVRGMGTTAVGCIITENATYIFNVGDSRLYAFYADGMTQMTEDHSVIAQLVRENRITPDQARTHSQRNTLTNALGVWRVFRIDINKIEPDWTALLLCSDGLHGYVSVQEIEGVVSDWMLPAASKVQMLIDMANRAGGFDNITAILLERSDGA